MYKKGEKRVYMKGGNEGKTRGGQDLMLSWGGLLLLSNALNRGFQLQN